jgi:hypothetical protein
MLRYSIGVPYDGYQSWPFYRRDTGGSGRQETPVHQGSVTALVDERSFICYPNPATTDFVTVRLVITSDADVRIRVMTVEGEVVVDRRRSHRWSTGSTVPFEEDIPTDSMASGIYICQVEIRGESGTWSGSRTFAVVR